MAIGHDQCRDCKEHPTHKIHPCGHHSCPKHYDYHGRGIIVCGTCNELIKFVGDIIPNLPQIKWSAEELKQIGRDTNTSSATQGIHPQHAMKQQQYSGDANEPEDGAGAPWRDSMRSWLKSSTFQRNKDAKTPTPDQGKDKKDATAQTGGENVQPQRYVPPALRGALSGLGVHPGNDRPRSSISNPTSSSQPALPQVDYRSAGLTIPHSDYRWGLVAPQQAADPFVDAPRQPASNSSSLTARPMHVNSGAPGGNFNPSMALQSAFSNTAPSFNNNASAPTAAGANVPQAVYFANLIMAGKAEDPTDIDYGNPGRSKRLPEAHPPTVPTAPLPRGKLASNEHPAVINYLQAESNIKGSAAAYLGTTDYAPPRWFFQSDIGYKPSVEEVLKMLPAIDACAIAEPTTAGVIKIMDIPYTATRSEIVSFLGRNARLVSQPEGSAYHAIHIIMDRHSAKTMDAFVELMNPREATFIANSFERRIKERRNAKIGDRNVTVKVVSQGDLMAELFPRAKNVEWAGPIPLVSKKVEYFYPGKASTGFQGFFQNEEIVMMLKHVENSSRSPFSQRVPIRCFEHVITLLHKYPWHAHQHVLLSERHVFYDLTLRYVRALMERLHFPDERPVVPKKLLPSESTLQELAVAALTCPGFSESQKAGIVLQLTQGNFKYLIEGRGFNLRFGGDHRFAVEWPFHALVRQPGVSDDVVEYVASLFRAATPGMEHLTPADIHAMSRSGQISARFGILNVNQQNTTTLADLARVESRAVEAALAKILRRENTGPSLALGGSA